MMKRRSFLQQAGLAIAGGSAAAGSRLYAAEPASAAREQSREPPTVLITSAGSQLCQAMAERLSGTWQVRMTAMEAVDTPFAFVESDLGAGDSIEAAVEGAAALVHLALPPADFTGERLIDFRTRGTYNLLRAAARHGVRQVVYLGSLATLRGYDPRFMITEQWQPRPAPDPGTLSHYLGEFTCREFARSGELDIAVLRCGRLDETEADAAGDAALPKIRIPDLTEAIALALGGGSNGGPTRLGPWQVIHVHSEADSSRFPLAKAGRLLDYRPQSSENGR